MDAIAFRHHFGDRDLELARDMALLDGEGMGEEIRVLIPAKGIDPAAVLDLNVLGGGPFPSGLTPRAAGVL
jgi:hypothetical protein